MPKPRLRKKNVKLLSHRPLKVQHETRRILHDNPTTPRVKYDPDVHPEGIIAFFRGRLDQVEDPERYVTEKGQVGYVVKPVRPPTISAYAAKTGLALSTITDWERKHEDFHYAVDMCRAIQEAVFVEGGTTGALNPSATNFALKNLQRWTDKMEQTYQGTVALQFDAQDANA